MSQEFQDTNRSAAGGETLTTLEENSTKSKASKKKLMIVVFILCFMYSLGMSFLTAAVKHSRETKHVGAEKSALLREQAQRERAQALRE